MSQQSIEIFVKSEGTITLDVTLNWTVTELRKKIESRLGWPPHMQRLIYSGKQLEDGHTLAHYNITKESTIYLVGRLGAGPPPPTIEFGCSTERPSTRSHFYAHIQLYYQDRVNHEPLKSLFRVFRNGTPCEGRYEMTVEKTEETREGDSYTAGSLMMITFHPKSLVVNDLIHMDINTNKITFTSHAKLEGDVVREYQINTTPVNIRLQIRQQPEVSVTLSRDSMNSFLELAKLIVAATAASSASDKIELHQIESLFVKEKEITIMTHTDCDRLQENDVLLVQLTTPPIA